MLKRLWWITLVVAIACSPNTKDDELVLIMTGDLMMDRAVRSTIEKHDVGHLFQHISPTLQQADYCLANLEGPVTLIEEPLNKEFVFRMEPDWMESVQTAGITHMSMANNHSNDQGKGGMVNTAEILVAANLGPMGYGKTQQLACEPVLLEKNGLEVSVYSSVMVPLENWMYLPDEPGICQATAAQLAESIAAEREAHPHRTILVYLHWGAEYQLTPMARQRQDGTSLVAAGADAIVGHHPHVVQTMEYINGKPVLYSLGNFVFDQSRPGTEWGLLAQFTVSMDSPLELELLPYELDGHSPAPMPVSDSTAKLQHFFKHSGSTDFTIEDQRIQVRPANNL